MPHTERASALRWARSAALSLSVCACLARTASAQAPSCAWGGGVTLPVSGDLLLLIASDGGAGVLAFTTRAQALLPPSHGVLHMFHVLEQGRLDPSLPASGVPILSGADLSSYVQLQPLRAIPDGAGGMYLLTQACDPVPPGPCYDFSQIRLQHVTAQGSPAAGWPALGHVIDALPRPGIESADIVPDGAGGVIAAWLDRTVATAPIKAQRFAADGTTLWTGGVAGLDVLTSTYAHARLRIAGDGAGGVVAVASRLVSTVDYRTELVACKVDAAGNLAWGAAGVPVMQQPTLSATPLAVTTDALGRSFIAAVVSAVNGSNPQFYTQSLTTLGIRSWSLFGVPIGPYGSGPSEQLLLSSGFTSLHPDPSGVPYIQIQDASGATQVGDPEGMPLDWTSAVHTPLPLATEDGHLILVWDTSYSPDEPEVRAIELDEWLTISPGWPEAGMAICGAIPGHEFGNAFVGAGHLFVGLTSSGWYGTQPMVQRLSREVLDVEHGLPTRALELALPRPNPALGAWSIEIAVREASPVTLEAFDVAGRRVLAEDFGTLEPGRHPLAAPAGASLAPGVYRVRVRAGAHAAERTLIRVR